MNLKVKSIKKERVLADNIDQLCVEFDIVDAVMDENSKKTDRVFETRKLGFPIDMPEKEIKKELKKFLATYELDEKQRKISLAQEEADKKANETINNLKNLTL